MQERIHCAPSGLILLSQSSQRYTSLFLFGSLGRMWEPWKETTTQLEAWSCTAHSSSYSLSPLNTWSKVSQLPPSLHQLPQMTRAFIPFSSPRRRVSFDLDYGIGQMSWNFYLSSPLQNGEKGSSLLHGPSRGVFRKHSSSHRKVRSSQLLWQRKLIMYLKWFSKVSK